MLIKETIDISNLETEMNRGFLHLLVLALLENEMYGYAMVKHIETLGYKVEENTLYPLLRRLEKNGWITSRWDLSEDRPRKFYTITTEGRTIRASLLDIWKIQNSILEKVTKENLHA
jgi:DNA-binding PadR family transcriptional regulator